MDASQVLPGTRDRLRAVGLSLQKATAEDAIAIGKNLRPIDATAAAAVKMEGPKLATLSYVLCYEAWVVRDNETGERIGILGVGPSFAVGAETMTGLWLYGTPALDVALRRNVRTTVLAAREASAMLQTRFGPLGNIVTRRLGKKCLPFIRAIGGTAIVTTNKDFLWMIGL